MPSNALSKTSLMIRSYKETRKIIKETKYLTDLESLAFKRFLGPFEGFNKVRDGRDRRNLGSEGGGDFIF